jgi:hypothetical protein
MMMKLLEQLIAQQTKRNTIRESKNEIYKGILID